jgi:hypothetical protein
LKELPSITESINNTPSRPLGGFAPADVTKENEHEVRYSAYLQRTKNDKKFQGSMKVKSAISQKSKKKSYKFKIGNKVRITHLRRLFQREYD